MRILRFTLFLAFALLAVTPAFAQPDGYVTGTYKIAMTIDGTRYKLPSGGYRISTAIIDGDSVRILNVWIATADAQGVLPAGSTIKGKQSSRTRFFMQTTAGQYQRIAMNEARIIGVGAGSAGTILQLELGGQDWGVIAPRDLATGQLKGTLRFPGTIVALGGGDWE